jgi:glyoxylase-like metal-dependent hydrolase (beta-lactamase superfamily II)
MTSSAEQLRDRNVGVAGLVAGTPEPLPFAPSLQIRAFLLRRDRGNVLVYSTGVVKRDAGRIAEAGGISRHYLNHRHEAMFPSAWVDAPLFVHAAERSAIAATYRVRGAFSRRHRLDADFEVIPIPGHTPGATAYLWDSGDHRLLFTGDTISLDEGEWVAAVLASSDRDAYVQSLETIRELDFDVLVPWAVSRGWPYLAHTDRPDAQARIDAILERLRRGEDR